jgi:hypothetical protein
VEEIYSLDLEQLKTLKPVHGLIFLFKWVADDNPPAGSVVLDSRADSMFFAKQVSHVPFSQLKNKCEFIKPKNNIFDIYLKYIQ